MNKTRGHIHNHGKEYNQIEATPGRRRHRGVRRRFTRPRTCSAAGGLDRSVERAEWVKGEREGKGRKARASGAPRPPLPLLLPLRCAFSRATLLLLAFRSRAPSPPAQAPRWISISGGRDGRVWLYVARGTHRPSPEKK